MTDRITRNAIRCKKCGETIVSTHRHDFRSCSCGFVTVDGGNDYLRRLWESGDVKDAFEELSEYATEEKKGA